MNLRTRTLWLQTQELHAKNLKERSFLIRSKDKLITTTTGLDTLEEEDTVRVKQCVLSQKEL